MKNARFVSVFLILVLLPLPAQAYLDHIAGVPQEEIWHATQEVLKTYGIHRSDEKNWTVESAWVVDRVKRSRGILKKITKKTYERRFQVKVQLIKRDYDIEVRVTGKFHERPFGTNPNLHWRRIKPELKDLQVERDIFIRILQRTEAIRQGR